MDKKAKIKLGIIFLFLIGVFSLYFVLAQGSFDPEDERQIGYEFLDDNKVIHIWNTQDDYFFDKSSGIQFTNHFQDYWSKNIFCIGYYSGGTWNKIKCADELTNFERSIESDDETYVNATLWKDFTYSGYDLRLGIRYHLGLNDKNLSVTIYGKNIGIDIPYDLGFAWKVGNLDVPSNKIIDKILINNTKYSLDGTYDLTFKNMTKKITDTVYNETCVEELEEFDSWEPCIINQTYSYEPTPFYKIYDHSGGLTGKENFLRVDWDENLNYAIKMYGDGNQSNFYTALLINAGSFSSGQEKSTTLYWIDALEDNAFSYYKCEEVSGSLADEVENQDLSATSMDYEQTGIIDDCVGGGNNKYLEADNAEYNWAKTDDFGINMWVTFNAYKTYDALADNTDVTSNGFYLLINTDGKPAIIQKGHSALWGNNGDLSGSGWQMVTLNHIDEVWTLYVNESKKIDTGSDLMTSTASHIYIGTNDQNLATRGHNGLIDEIYIRSGGGFSEAEIAELFASGSPGSAQQYPFIANTCTYSSGNWDVECSDYCNITDVVSLPSNNLTLNGTGIFTILANITVDMLIMDTNCQVVDLVGDNKKLDIV